MKALRPRDTVIAKLETARNALREATSVHRVKTILDVAAASEVYARRQQLGDEAIGYAHAIKVEALGRLGELLRDMPKATGTRGDFRGKDSSGSYRKEPPENSIPTLADLHVDRKTAMVAQHLAELPENVRQAIARRETTLTEARRQQRHVARQTGTAPVHSRPAVTEAMFQTWEQTRRDLEAAQHAADEGQRRMERETRIMLAPLWRVLEHAQVRERAAARSLLTETLICESDEPCPALTLAEVRRGCAEHASDERGHRWWRAAGFPDPGKFETCAYRQYWRPGDPMVLDLSAWALGSERPGPAYRQWVVCVSAPGHERWARSFWFRGVSRAAAAPGVPPRAILEAAERVLGRDAADLTGK